MGLFDVVDAVFAADDGNRGTTGGGGFRGDRDRKILGLDFRAAGENRGAFDGVPQLAEISGS